MTTYKPGVYQKGDDVRTAQTPSDAVNLAFQGFKRVDSESEAEQTPKDAQTAAPEFPEPESLVDGEVDFPDFPDDEDDLGPQDEGKEPWS